MKRADAAAPLAGKGAEGFTLIELLVVLTIIGLLASIAIGGLRHSASLDRGKLHATLGIAAEEARARAQASGRKTMMDLSRSQMRGTVFEADPGFEPGPAFYPDGSASGGSFRRDGQVVAVLDWATGQVGDDAR